MSISGVTASAAAALGAPETKTDSPKKVQDAVQQFEALMLTQLLKTAREAGGANGWFGTGDDQAGALGMEYAEQEFARMLAAGGGLGLAKIVASGLKREPAVDAQ
jgi:Rod binding domain-containing protein